MTAALVTLGCTLGVNLPPLMLASSLSKEDLAKGSAGTLLTADSLKLAAKQHKWTPDQVRVLQADIDALTAAQQKLNAFQGKLTADHIKLKANQEKLKVLQADVSTAQARLSADQIKITRAEKK